MKKILLLLIMALSSSAFSQNIRFEGAIKDSTGVGLDMANVMAVNQQTKVDEQLPAELTAQGQAFSRKSREELIKALNNKAKIVTNPALM